MKSIRTTLWISAALIGLVGLAAAPAAADQVFLDDVIVDGSLCVGVDCVNGESFGFDTIRLKENNLRIKFQDTSTSASFPTNDWQLTANDSTNGGANKFSIDDIDGGRTPFTIEAGAPSHSLYVDDGGRIGLGTSTPVVEVHIVDGDTPTLRLEQDGSSGFTPQTWDVAGNETNFFIRDVTNGSKLPLRIRPAAPTNSIFVDTAGQVGMGTASPDGSAMLTLAKNGTVRLTFDHTGTGTDWVFQSVDATGDFRISDVGDGVSEFNLTPDGDLTVTGDYFSLTCTSPGSPCAPDYVFAADYPLMPLADLAKFIEEKSHLPNVPSENDLREAGKINNSQFQMTLLEKIEELVLYTLEQQSTIDALQARLQAVETTVQAEVQ